MSENLIINYHYELNYDYYYYNDMISNHSNNIFSMTNTFTYSGLEDIINDQEHIIQVGEMRINLEQSHTYGEDDETLTYVYHEPISIDDEILTDDEMAINNFMYLSNGDKLIETCSICLDDVTDIESTSKLSCGHHFHTNCISLCLQRNLFTCPLCRNPIQFCIPID